MIDLRSKLVRRSFRNAATADGPTAEPGRGWVALRTQASLLAPLLAWCVLVSLLSGPLGSQESVLRLLPTWLQAYLARTDPITHAPDATAAGWGMRKLAHLAEYAVMALLASRWLSRGTRLSTRAAVRLAFGFCVAFASGDEYHQSFVPTRTPAVTDVLIDALGAALALGAGWDAARRHRRRRA